MAKPRLIVLASTYPRWKNEHEPSFVHALAQRLTDRFDVIAVVPHAPGSARHEVLDGVTVSRYRYAPQALETLVNDGGIAANLRNFPWKWVLLPSFIAMQWWEARRLRTRDTVIHAHWLIPQGIVARVLARPFVVTSHGADVFSLLGELASSAKRFAVRGARSVTVVSEAMVSPLLELGALTVPQVMPMGVDLSSTFVPDAQVVREAAHLLFVGRLVEKKGVDVLLRAMRLVLSKHPGARLTIIGHGPLEGSLRELAADLSLTEKVAFAGPLPQADLVPFYRRASAFVGPFRQAASGDQEGLGLVMVEALGCGCPIVASDLPATRDVLMGTPGCLMVPPEDAEKLADAIVSVLDDPVLAAKRAEDGVHIMRERFDWVTVARGYADVIESAMKAAA